MKRKIFFDFDGTLLDPRQRMYSLFQELTPVSSFSFDEYWDIKRNRINQNDLLKSKFQYLPEQIQAFKKSWLNKIEERHRLDTDKPFEGVSDLLSSLAKDHDLYLVTARQTPEHVAHQLEKFGWTSHFKKVLVTRQTNSKAGLILVTETVTPQDILIGDTGEDILTAKELGMISVGVCSGFLCRKILEEYKPDYLLESVLELHETSLL